MAKALGSALGLAIRAALRRPKPLGGSTTCPPRGTEIHARVHARAAKPKLAGCQNTPYASMINFRCSKLTNPLISLGSRPSLGSASLINGLANSPASMSNDWTITDTRLRARNPPA